MPAEQLEQDVHVVHPFSHPWLHGPFPFLAAASLIAIMISGCERPDASSIVFIAPKSYVQSLIKITKPFI